MRARLADRSGYVEREGVRIYYEVYGTAAFTLLLLPCWSIVHSRVWKAQIPYLAHTYRVVAFDGRGNGLSGRPGGAEAYRAEEYVADAIAVMDATETERAVLVGFSFGGHLAALLAANHPERVVSAMLVAPAAPFGPGTGVQTQRAFLEPSISDKGWAKYNRHYWLRDFRGFIEFFFQEAVNEPHSTKQIEDCIAWAFETSAETLIDTVLGRFLSQADDEQTYRKIRCPVVVVHGDRDAIVPYARGQRVAEAIGAPLLTLGRIGSYPDCARTGHDESAHS
jgi:pimeloyl-ACP methyl ester carboxylesterase